MRRAWVSLILAASANLAQAADISVTGTWWRTVHRDDLVAGAGTDLVSTLESPAGVSMLSVTGTAGGRWRLEVARTSDANWPAGVDIAIRCSSAIDGDTAYLPLTHSAQTLLEGAGDRQNIQVQLRVDGATVQSLAATYSVIITYTIVTVSS